MWYFSLSCTSFFEKVFQLKEFLIPLLDLVSNVSVLISVTLLVSKPCDLFISSVHLLEFKWIFKLFLISVSSRTVVLRHLNGFMHSLSKKVSLIDA